MKMLLFTFLYFVLLAGPVFVFEELFRNQFEPWELKGGVYRDAPGVYLLAPFFFALLLSWILPRFLGKVNFTIMALCSYCVFYTFLCSEVAFDYRINFGTTWLPGEVFRGLVLTKWYFYVCGAVGLIFFMSVIYINVNGNHAKVTH